MLPSVLTGGIGSGKSTVAAGLADRGALIIDADGVSREIVEPDGPAFAAVVERFGPEVVGPDGRLNRPALAAIVFNDPDALADLNAITHPVIGRVMVERASAPEVADRVVVLDVALLPIVTAAFERVDGIIVVDTPEDRAVERLVTQRGLGEADARARIAAQISREERRATADLVIDNSGDRDALEAQIDRAWAWLVGRRQQVP